MIGYLDAQPMVIQMQEDIASFLERWIPNFEANARVYMTVALGCTGGQHRSVFMAERLTERFRQRFDNVLIRHREIEKGHTS